MSTCEQLCVNIGFVKSNPSSDSESKEDTLVVPTPSKEQNAKADANILDLAAVTILLKEQTNFGRTYSSDEKGKARADPVPPTMARHNRNQFMPAGRWVRFQIWFNTYK